MTVGRRRTPLSRGAGPKSKRRKASEFQRIYGGRDRVRWVKSLPCIAAPHGCVGAIENAHTENGGMGRKADASSIVPACGLHHRALHILGAETFQFRYRVDLKAEAARVAARWDAMQGGERA